MTWHCLFISSIEITGLWQRGRYYRCYCICMWWKMRFGCSHVSTRCWYVKRWYQQYQVLFGGELTVSSFCVLDEFSFGNSVRVWRGRFVDGDERRILLAVVVVVCDASSTTTKTPKKRLPTFGSRPFCDHVHFLCDFASILQVDNNITIFWSVVCFSRCCR